MLQALWKQEFNLGGKNYTFDDRGDINLGYDVTMWRSHEGNIHVHDVVAEYHLDKKSFTYTNHNTSEQLLVLRVGPHSAALISFCTYTHSDTHTYPQQCVFTENMQIIKTNVSNTEREDFSFNIQVLSYMWKLMVDHGVKYCKKINNSSRIE